MIETHLLLKDGTRLVVHRGDDTGFFHCGSCEQLEGAGVMGCKVTEFVLAAVRYNIAGVAHIERGLHCVAAEARAEREDLAECGVAFDEDPTQAEWQAGLDMVTAYRATMEATGCSGRHV